MIDAWVKSRRAANETDYETWIWGGVSPTLNAFDNATETRATVIAFYSSGGGNDAPAQDISPTVKVGGSLGIPSPPAVAYGITDDETVAQELLPTIPTPSASGGGHPPAVAYGFSGGNSANAYGIGLTEEGTPPLRAAASGSNQVPTVIHPTVKQEAAQQMKVRRLTPRECERLQGFPDDWTLVSDKTADSHRYKQMGNAVTVNVAAYIGRLIMDKVAADAS